MKVQYERKMRRESYSSFSTKLCSMGHTQLMSFLQLQASVFTSVVTFLMEKTVVITAQYGWMFTQIASLGQIPLQLCQFGLGD